MKFKVVLLLAVLASLPALAQLSVDTPAASGPPDNVKLSYAMGMRLGIQRKNSSADADPDIFMRGLTAVLEGKPTDVKEQDIPELFRAARLNQVDPKANPAPDKVKFAYALGMLTGKRIKRTGMELDPKIISEALHDVMDGKPTKLQESEIDPLFKQAKAYVQGREAEKNSAEGKAFLAKNAQDKSVTVLPDGLQYQVIHEGTGAIPKTNDIVELTYAGTMINGKEVETRSHVKVRAIAPIKGFQEALQKMKVGSKWKLFIPAELAYGHEGLDAEQIGPNTTLIYELELNDIIPPDKLAEFGGTGHMGHGLSGYARPGAAGEDKSFGAQTNVVTGDTPNAAK